MPYSDYIGRLTQLLRQAYIHRPRPDVLDLIVRRFSSRLLAVTTVDQAVDLYRDAEFLPGSSTSSCWVELHSLRLNGPFAEQLPQCILTALDSDGNPAIVKLLAVSSHDPMTGAPASQLSEAFVCRELRLRDANNAGVPVVRGEVLELQLPFASARTTKHGPGVYPALVMPRYSCVVSDLPLIPEHAIARGAARLMQAIDFMHERGYVHMDIKATNVFVDTAGNWYLGDFGSTVRVNDPIHSYTRWFFPNNMAQQAAQFKHDWYLLAVMLAVELHKEDWKEQLFEHERVSTRKLRIAASAAQLESLKEVLALVMGRGEVTVDEGGALG
ncbi:hypothetical protein JKP88DRAFT_166388 [Tribonema minus]|uniref:Protein kinase domain-containing protein n=1 Tax=Tribonema minus TaxID=303371 RepID=A0A836CCZ9_9STRA|nr:hypothetical protein JKP88DRAFT_166388 [Tribonema minus]